MKKVKEISHPGVAGVKKERIEECSEILKAIANSTRLLILLGIFEDECNVKRIQRNLNLPQSTVSQHLSIMRAKKIVKSRRQGVTTCYIVSDEFVRKVLQIIRQFWSE